MPLRFCPLLALGLGAVLLLTEAAGLAGLGWAPHHAVLEPWTSCAAGGGLCFPFVFASTRGRRWLLGLSVVAMALVVLSVLAAGGNGADAGAAAGWGPGLVACGALGWRARGRGRLAGRLLAAWALLPLATTVKPFFTEGTRTLMRGTVDAQIARLDALTGTEPAAVMATLAEGHPSLDALLTLAYLLLPVAMTSVAALQARRRPRQPGLLPAFLLASVLVSPLYVLLPAIGPGPWFGTGFAAVLNPDAPGAVLDATHARNAMPSMHVAWATLCLLGARELGPVPMRLAGAFLALTCLSTLALGEHYLLDLVVAAPFVLVVRGLCAAGAPERARRAAVGGGALMLLAWGLAIRGDAGRVLAPDVGVAAMVATVLASALLERRLWAAWMPGAWGWVRGRKKAVLF